MTPTQQIDDTHEQINYLENEAEQYGYNSIEQLFQDEPELFDILAQEWRNSNN